jgi:hypothetical protein
MKNIKFVGEAPENLIYNPNKFTDSFYQICQFKNPSSNLYQTRKIIFNQNYDIIKIFEKEYNAKTLQKFIKLNEKYNKHKMYPTNNIKYVDLPNGCDFLVANSNLTNQQKNNNKLPAEKYTGFDLFNSMTYSGLLNTHTMASPGSDITNFTRKVGGVDDDNFYTGAPNLDNLMMINNNSI